MNYDNTWETLFTQDAQQRLSVQGFYWGLVTYLLLSHTKIPDAQKESGCSA